MSRPGRAPGAKAGGTVLEQLGRAIAERDGGEGPQRLVDEAVAEGKDAEEIIEQVVLESDLRPSRATSCCRRG